MKKISSTEGQKLAATSPFYSARLKDMEDKVKTIKKAIKARDFSTFGKICEMEALNMHAICITCNPAIIYWEPTTISVIKSVVKWRQIGAIESYFTIDAGSSVHVICKEKDSNKLVKRLKELEAVQQVVVNKPAKGAHIITKHLF